MELILPKNYTEVGREEIMYLEGGVWVTQQTASRILASVALNPAAVISGAAGVVGATKLVRAVSRFSGPLGWVAGAVLSYAGAQVVTFALALSYTALYGSRDISFSWNPLKFGVQY